jgi:hypothetical protein
VDDYSEKQTGIDGNENVDEVKTPDANKISASIEAPVDNLVDSVVQDAEEINVESNEPMNEEPNATDPDDTVSAHIVENIEHPVEEPIGVVDSIDGSADGFGNVEQSAEKSTVRVVDSIEIIPDVSAQAINASFEQSYEQIQSTNESLDIQQPAIEPPEVATETVQSVAENIDASNPIDNPITIPNTELIEASDKAPEIVSVKSAGANRKSAKKGSASSRQASELFEDDKADEIDAQQAFRKRKDADKPVLADDFFYDYDKLMSKPVIADDSNLSENLLTL